MTDSRRPLHLAVMFGASTALYAVSMAGVSALQSDADRALDARRPRPKTRSPDSSAATTGSRRRSARPPTPTRVPPAGYDALARRLLAIPSRR